jgi:putative oxidoreductase
MITTLRNLLILKPLHIAHYFLWAGPLIARITVGYVFMLTGWGKLQNLERVTAYFASLNIPFASLTTPFVSALEFVGGLCLMLGLLTRIMGGGLAITMIVAIISAKWAEIDSLSTLLGFEESLYLAIFTWLAICGAGKASLDYLIEKTPSPASLTKR